MEFAYQADRPEFITDLRQKASKVNYLGLTANISNRPYLIIAKEGDDYVMENADGNVVKVPNGTFEYFARDEHNAIVAASRTENPFIRGTVIGEWVIGKLQYDDGI